MMPILRPLFTSCDGSLQPPYVGSVCATEDWLVQVIGGQ